MATNARISPKQARREAKVHAKAVKNSQSKLAQRNLEESKKTGTPIPFGSQDKASFLRSTEAQPVSINTNTPAQQHLLQQLAALIPQGLQGLNLPGQQSSFAPIAEQARANFNENTIPGLAERFASLGSGGSLNSSAFGQTLSSAGAGLERDLAALQAQHGLQEQGLQSNNLFNLLSAGLRPQFDYGIVPGQNSGVRNAWEGVKQPLINAGVGYLTGGPAGAAIGGLSGLAASRQQQQQQPQSFIQGLGGSGVTQGNSFGFANNTQAPAPFSVQGLASAGYNGNIGGGQQLGYNDILNSISAGYRGY